MSTATPGGGSESSGFGSLLAGKKYFFSIVVSGKLPRVFQHLELFQN